MWLAPESSAARAPSIAAWRRTASNLSRTAGSIMRGRSGFRPLRRARPFAYFLKNGRGRMAGHDGNRDNTASRSFHFLAANDLVTWPIVALHKDIREQARDELARREVIKNHHGVHGFQGGENLGALAFGDNRAAFSLQLADTRVPVEPDDQRIG